MVVIRQQPQEPKVKCTIFSQLVDHEDVAGVEMAVTPPRYARNQVEMPQLWAERKRPRTAVTELSLPLRPCRSRWKSSGGPPATLWRRFSTRIEHAAVQPPVMHPIPCHFLGCGMTTFSANR